MKLTLAKIKTLPIGKKISDGQGLCLTKTAPNKGRWEHRYMINKRARVMALGTFPEISLIYFDSACERLSGDKIKIFYIFVSRRGLPSVIL